MRIAIIADDLTGAADSAAAFWRAGATILLEPSAIDNACDATVVSLDLDVRDRPQRAASSYREAFLAMDALGEIMIFLKIDSTLRGPVEDAIAAACGEAPVIVAPAFPAQGRTMANGRLLLDKVPVEETRYGRGQGMRSGHGDLVARLQARELDVEPVDLATIRNPLRLAKKLRAATGTILVCDADMQSDLDNLATIALAQCPAARFVGAAGLSRAIAYASEATRAGEGPPIIGGMRGSVLFVLGTAAEATRHQRARLPVRIIETAATGQLAPEGAAEAAREIASGRDCVIALPPPGGGPLDGDLVAKLVASLPPIPPSIGAIVLSGGATARAVLDRIGASRLDLVAEPLPGIAVSIASDHPGQPRIVLKAGGFGDPDALVTIRDFLHRDRRDIGENIT